MNRFATSQSSLCARILVIDDDISFGRLIRRMFDESPHYVRSALTIEKGNELLQSESFDLIILDHVFPNGREGLEFLRRLKNAHELWDIPVLFVTGKATGDEMARAIDIGAADCIAKPFSPALFKAKAERLLTRHRAERDGASKNRHHILHVEDDDGWADLVRTWLLAQGYTLHRVAGRREMLDYLQSRREAPSCILMDLNLANDDGLTLCDELKATPRMQGTPIIILTARKDKQVAGLRHQAVHVVVKSDNARDELVAAIESVTEQHNRSLGILDVEDIRLDPRFQRIYQNDRLIATLSPGLFALFHLLVLRTPSPVSVEELYDISADRSRHKGCQDANSRRRTVETYMSKLRGILGSELGQSIRHIPRAGYIYVVALASPRRKNFK